MSTETNIPEPILCARAVPQEEWREADFAYFELQKAVHNLVEAYKLKYNEPVEWEMSSITVVH